MQLLIWLCICWGFVYVVTDSTIFAPIRIHLAARSKGVASFIYCSYCVGFWVGFGFVLDTAALDWAWTWNDAHVVFEAICGGALVMGATAAVRGFSNGFLFGAWERERDIVERIRGAELDERDGERAGDDDDGGVGGLRSGRPDADEVDDADADET